VRKKLIEDVRKDMRSEEVVEKLSRTFSVLGDSTRTRIIFALSKHELCVAELSPPPISLTIATLPVLILIKCSIIYIFLILAIVFPKHALNPL